MSRRTRSPKLGLATLTIAALVGGAVPAGLLAGASTADSTTPAAPPAGDPKPGGTLRVSGDAEVANPWVPAVMQCDSYCLERAATFYDTLTIWGNDNQVHPFLAESVTPNDKFTEFTIKLRSGIKFHDGTDFNADAAIRNLLDQGDSLLTARALIDVARVPAPTDQDPKHTAFKIEKKDDLTFVIYTGKNGDPSKPVSWAAFPAYLSGQVGMMASPKYLDAVKAGGDATKAVGTGPFMVESYAPRDKLVVVKNPNYWLKDAKGTQLPYLDKIEFRVIEDSEVTSKGLQAGQVDLFSSSIASLASDYKDNTKFGMEVDDQFVETNYALIDLDKKGPLQDRRVRCALSMAIDRQEYVDTLADGNTKIANGIFSPGQEGYLEDNGFSTEQNVDEAKRLIEEYEKETGTQVKVNWGTTNAQVNQRRADLLKGWWTAIGADFEYIQVPQDSFITDALFGKDTFHIFGWRQHSGPLTDSQYLWWHSSGAVADNEGISLNFARLRDPVIDAGLEKARSGLTPEERKAGGQEVNRQMAKECYNIPFDYAMWIKPHVLNLKGFNSVPIPDGATARDSGLSAGSVYFAALWLEQ